MLAPTRSLPESFPARQEPIQIDDAHSLARFYKISVALVRRLTRTDKNFPVIRIGRACRYDRAAIRAYFEQRNSRGGAE